MELRILNGLYFDGVSSRPYKAQVTVERSGIVIEFPEDPDRESIRWDHSRIHTADIPGSIKVCLKYGEFPHEVIEIDAPDFFDTLRAVYPQAPYIKTAQNFFLSRGWQWLAGAFAFLVCILLVSYFVLLPLVASFVVSVFPKDTEIDLGKRMAENLLESEKVDKDKTVSMNHFLHQLKLKSDYPIHVTVVESDIKNAFAIPGGEIVVYTALLNEMKSYSELVALLGHEIAHVEERHSLKMLAKSLALYLLISTVFQDVNGIIAVFTENASALERLSYNRNLESEADDKGLQFVLNNHVDPKGMIELFDHLKGDDKQLEIPDFLTTHPSLDARMDVLRHKLPTIKYRVEANDSLKYYWEEIKWL